jgi:lysozyme
MKTSKAGREKLEAREGTRLKAYRDSVGVWTIGVGHTSAAGLPKVTSTLKITAEECDAIFARDLVKYEKTVNEAVKVPITQTEFDALVSLCFNIGQGGFAKSTVVRRLNAKDRKGAAAAFMMWNKPKEIIGRRTGEMKQFLSGAP